MQLTTQHVVLILGLATLVVVAEKLAPAVGGTVAGVLSTIVGVIFGARLRNDKKEGKTDGQDQ